jgi:hypothetical protein
MATETTDRNATAQRHPLNVLIFSIGGVVATGLVCLYFLFFRLVPDIVFPPAP